MRLLFLIPELIQDRLKNPAFAFLMQHRRLTNLPIIRVRFISPWLYVSQTYGGTLNIMRHCALARSLGADARLLTPTGKDTYGQFSVVDCPYVPWSDVRDDDVCVVPEFCAGLVDRLKGPAIVYLQIPTHLYRNFDYLSSRVRLWTDSPFMLEKSKAVYSGKDISIVPNIVDPIMFPFRPQSEREPGLIFAFPRKGPEFISATRDAYSKLGGKYWKFELIDGLTLSALAVEMQRPQAFLASADIEGCALPPQESMAAGLVVVGKSARGANFAMEHRHTAMVADTPDEAAQCLLELENEELRDAISRNGHKLISRYFPDGEPTEFWSQMLQELGIPT